MPIPITFEKSFASHPRSIFWSKKNKKQPRDVRKSSHIKCLFDCNLCGHEFEKRIADITNSNTWCGFCAIPSRKLCDKSDCKLCYDKSFSSHPKHLFWSSKNLKHPREVFKSTSSKYLFDCEKCDHEFEMSLECVSNGCWCGFCSTPPKYLCDNENCKLCFDKSFASHEKHLFWSSKNLKQPRDVFKSSASKYLFVCENKHEFESTLDRINCGHWCPSCKNKTETKLFEKIQIPYSSIIRQFKQDWCKNQNNNYYLPFDFCIPEPKIIIELDGRQHFIQVMNWPTPEENFERDKYKEKCANDNGYSTIRIIQEDVWNDKYDWCKELCEAIENIKNGNIKNGNNIYLCKNGEYDKFIQNDSNIV